jgi:hypothetical protein
MFQNFFYKNAKAQNSVPVQKDYNIYQPALFSTPV